MFYWTIITRYHITYLFVCVCFCDVIIDIIKCVGIKKVLNLKHEMCDVIAKVLSLQMNCVTFDLCTQHMSH